MHPEDAKALQVLRRLKGFDELIRLSMEYGYEQLYRGENLGMLLKVNADNFPDLYLAFKEVVNKVGIRKPELYNLQRSCDECLYLWRNKYVYSIEQFNSRADEHR